MGPPILDHDVAQIMLAEAPSLTPPRIGAMPEPALSGHTPMLKQYYSKPPSTH